MLTPLTLVLLILLLGIPWSFAGDSHVPRTCCAPSRDLKSCRWREKHDCIGGEKKVDESESDKRRVMWLLRLLTFGALYTQAAALITRLC